VQARPAPALVAVAAAVAAGLAFAGAGCREEDGEPDARTPPSQHFRSRPDLRPPVVTVTTRASGADEGYVFLAPKRGVAQAGPMIVDAAGRLVWFRPLDTKGVSDFRVQSYGGRPVLTWWRGSAVKGVGEGYYVIVDGAYHQIATVTAGNGLTGDIHEFLITPRGTALITVYRRVARDLTPVGGPRQGSIYEGVVQELDIATGRVLFEWHSGDHVALAESYVDPPPATRARGAKAGPYDYFHVNSIDLEPDGKLLVSARNTHAVYEISRPDGRILWRLGGKRSDFTMGPGTSFEWQHDARRREDGTITLFDNAAAPKTKDHSRVLVLRLSGSRATLVRSYAHPRDVLAGSQGNAQLLPGGRMFVGWGAEPRFTEFSPDGRVLLDGTFGKGADSYRAYRFPWSGRPADDPSVALGEPREGSTTVFASWNGATDVARWQVLAGPDENSMRVVASAPRRGFETAIAARTAEPRIRVRALDARGAVLGTSRAVAAGAEG
jgi:hypothetical protein